MPPLIIILYLVSVMEKYQHEILKFKFAPNPRPCVSSLQNIVACAKNIIKKLIDVAPINIDFLKSFFVRVKGYSYQQIRAKTRMWYVRFPWKIYANSHTGIPLQKSFEKFAVHYNITDQNIRLQNVKVLAYHEVLAYQTWRKWTKSIISDNRLIVWKHSKPTSNYCL